MLGPAQPLAGQTTRFISDSLAIIDLIASFLVPRRCRCQPTLFHLFSNCDRAGDRFGMNNNYSYHYSIDRCDLTIDRVWNKEYTEINMMAGATVYATHGMLPATPDQDNEWNTFFLAQLWFGENFLHGGASLNLNMNIPNGCVVRYRPRSAGKQKLNFQRKKFV